MSFGTPTGWASKLALDVLNGRVTLLCARSIDNGTAERCKRPQGHDGLCRSWLDPEEESPR
jgi:hypothetical protein